MKNAIFWDIETQFVPYRKSHVSSAELSCLMLYTIWCFHGGGYEKCRPLGCKKVWLTLLLPKAREADVLTVICELIV
jgi:hypothetical protein